MLIISLFGFEFQRPQTGGGKVPIKSFGLFKNNTKANWPIGTKLDLATFIKFNDESHLKLSSLPSYKNALLLQGPVGPFFSKLAHFLRNRGTQTHKINFNPGDEFFYPKSNGNCHLYDFTLEYWPQFLERYLVQEQIDAIFLFGDCRPIHKPAKELCKEYGLDLWVFEEGYFRPNFFTLEYFGVNAYSRLFSSTLDDLLNQRRDLPQASIYNHWTTVFKLSHVYITRHAIIYWLMNVIQPFKCANYDHHRQLNFVIALRWIKNFIAHWVYKIKDQRKINFLLDGRLSSKKNYFLFPLQVHDDAQMTEHSDFKSVEDALEMVLTSFYRHHSLNKNLNTTLIIKHHPMDRGHKNYAQFIKTLTQNLGIQDQVHYLHELDLDEILPYCKGCITVNSTLGLKALVAGVPVKNLGRSFYDKFRLTSQKTLNQFWKNPGSVSHQDVLEFKNFVISQTQVNGCLYSPKYELQ